MSKKKHDITSDFAQAVIKVNTAFRQFIQTKFKQEKVDLTFEMFQVMVCLWQQDGINQQEIANLTFKDKASMTYLVDNLTKRQLLYRQEDDSDRRNKLIFLTEKGKQLQSQIQPVITEMYHKASENVPTEAIQTTIDLFSTICSNLENTA